MLVTQLPLNYPEDALPPGTPVNGYTIKSVLGRGTFGITYLAEETHLERLVAIKEYLPEMAATREQASQVVAKPGQMGELFHQQLANFLEEAKTLVKFNHPNVVRVLTYFPAFGTAYLVMEYEVGMDLNQYLKQHPKPSEQTLLGIFSPIVQGLAAVHSSGYIHRDIKAGNIYIRDDGSPVLLDFGAARNVISADVNHLTRILTVGYAPYEQDNPSWSEQGPWTDIYALAATLYYCITAKRPVSSTDRAGAIFGGQEDPYSSIMSLRPQGYSLNFLTAIDKALRFKPEERPQSALEWDALLNESDAEKTVFAGTSLAGIDNATNSQKASQTAGLVAVPPSIEKKPSKILPGLLVVALLTAGVYFLVPSLFTQDQQAEQIPSNGAVAEHSNEAITSSPVIQGQEDQPVVAKPTVVESSTEVPIIENSQIADKAQESNNEALVQATLEQSKSTVVSTLLLGKTAAWHFARGERINDLITQIKSLPATADRTRFIVDQESKKRQSEEGFNSNYVDYESAIVRLRELNEVDIETTLQDLFTQGRYAEDQTYRALSQLIKKHAASDSLDAEVIRTDLIELSRSSAFIDS